MSVSGEIPSVSLPKLSMEHPRDEIHSRLVGPLNAVALLHAIDTYRASGDHLEDATALRQRYNDSIDRAETYNDFSTILNDGLGRRLRHGVMHRVHQGDHAAASLTRGQQNMLELVTTGGEIEGNVSEGIQAQVNATLRLGYPAVLIAVQGLRDGPAVLNAATHAGLEGVAKTIRRPAFPRLLSRLGATANRMYERSEVRQYVDDPEQFPALTLKKIVNHYAVESDGIPDDVSIYNLLRADPTTNEYGITPAAHAVLKYYLRYSNELRPMYRLGKLTSASRGCPLVQRTAEINPNDYTDQQLSALTEGATPIASISEAHDKVILRFERNAFGELNTLLADVLDGTEQKA